MIDEERVEAAVELINRAVDESGAEHVFGCFSGGHDSLCATHVASQSKAFTAAFHANTGIGIPETREFVRETCRREGWPLIEYEPQERTYDEMVLEWGFPRGPKSHHRMYDELRHKSIARLVREYKRFRTDRVILVTGIRSQESDRRMNRKMAAPTYRQGSWLWVNPILEWTAVDVSEYVDGAGLERNEVVDHLHRSGECLCGAFANPNEIEEIELWYPEAAERIHELERRCRERGLVDCVWATSQAPGRTWRDVHPSEVDLQMCMSCVRPDRKPMPPDGDEG